MTWSTQLSGSLGRIAIEKKRNIRGTFCEYFSHLILLLLLVFGYNLSTVEHYDNETYSRVDLTLPLENATNSQILDVFKGPLPIPDIDTYSFLGNTLRYQFSSYRRILQATDYGAAINNLVKHRSLHFAPEGAMTEDLISHLNKTYKTFNARFVVHVHKDEDSALSYIKGMRHEPFGLIVLREISQQKVNYLIRQVYSVNPDTNQITKLPTIGLDQGYLKYIFGGYLTMKKAIDQWAFNYTGAVHGNDPACALGPPNTIFTPYPTFAYDQNPFYSSVGFLLGLAMIMSTMYPMSKLAKSVVEEKELRMRELMKIMGLQDWVHQLSWFLTSFVLFLWIAITATIVTTVSFIKASNPGIIFLFFLLFTMSEINLAFMVSVFFSNSKLAAIAAPVVIFATILPRYIFYTVSSNEEVANKILACFLSPTAFAFGADFISSYEYAGVGIQTYNLFENDFNFGTCLLMMLADFFIYGFLAWYLDQIVPQEHGTPKHPLFILDSFVPYFFPSELDEGGKRLVLDFDDMEEFRDVDTSGVVVTNIEGRTGGSKSRSGSVEMHKLRAEASATTSTANPGPGRGSGLPHIHPSAQQHPHNLPPPGSKGKYSRVHCIEHLPRKMLKRGKVRIKHLGKTYPDGKVAVRDFSLTMLEGQITCLLGHNGAGKSTTISALTGMTEATVGDVFVYGHYLGKELPAIRQLTGLCPQQNVLFPMLTVWEHLIFFGKLKGLSGEALQSHVQEMIQEVGLTEKRNIQSQALSGGMKRKLCLAMALIGDPKFVLLDEPTSGMDPYSRRATWELLQKRKTGRVMLLTTHFMDEADTLADRIAIMSEGVLLCSGSSLFLKNRFGAGYLLSCTKVSSDVPVEGIDAEVKAVISSAQLLSAVAGEVIFQLPLSSVSNFARLFSVLEESKGRIGLKSFGISITTLEQVFISLAHAGDPNLDYDPPMTIFDRAYNFLKRGLALFGQASNPISSFGSKDSTRYSLLAHDHAAAQAAGLAIKGDSVKPSVRSSSNSSNARNGKEQKSRDGRGYQRVLKTAGEDVITSHEAEDKLAMGHVDYDGIGQVKIWHQTLELYRKRLIIASRDLKGFFFQIIFPAVQILLILLMLNITINPAGHTIILNGNFFHRYGSIDAISFIANPSESSFSPQIEGGFRREILGNMSQSSISPSSSSSLTQAMDKLGYTVELWNSSFLSTVLLDKRLYENQRYGAFIFGDKIPLHLNVNWDMMKADLQANPNVGEDINSILEGMSGKDYSYTYQVDPATVLNNNNQIPPGTTNAFVTLNRNGITVQLVNKQTGLTLLTQTTPWKDVTYQTIAPFLPEQSSGTYDLDLDVPYSILHNATSPHAIAAWHGELTEAMFQTCVGNPDANYYVKNHPLPLNTKQSMTVKVVLSVLTSVFILVPLCYIPPAFVSFLVRERVSKSKHLQQASGVAPMLYWAGAYLWDMSLFSILTGFVLLAFLIVGKSSSSVFVGSAESNLAVFCLLMTYGASAIPLNYLYSFAFTNHSTAQITLTLLNFMTGFVLVLAYYVMDSIEETRPAAEVLVHLFRFFPAYNVGDSFINLSTSYYEHTILGKDIGPFDWGVCGRSLTFMFVEAIGYSSLVLLSESSTIRDWMGKYNSYQAMKYGPPPPPKNEIDDDVKAEEEIVRKYALARHSNSMDETISPMFGTIHTSAMTDDSSDLEEGFQDDLPGFALLISDLIKTYVPLDFSGKPKYAVRGLSLACSEGERFGLLGINGAGKTTTLGILTGEIALTSGSVFIGNRPLSDSLTQRMLGYCPQVDPLLDLMTGYETLRFFGRIRGIKDDILERRVRALVRQTGLLPHAHRPCGTYSGGNKRKLSLAVALIGDPKVLLLDEPSTGMDPEARRHMWNVIEQVSEERTVILVSHSMEEIEALCTRVGVMVSGRMQCLGSVQHLKNKFGGAYTIELRCHADPSNVAACLSMCQSALSGAVLEEQHGGFLRLRVEIVNMNLAVIFALLEEHKERLQIYDYSVSQCSLEQVFIKFAKEQEEEPEIDLLHQE